MRKSDFELWNECFCVELENQFDPVHIHISIIFHKFCPFSMRCVWIFYRITNDREWEVCAWLCLRLKSISNSLAPLCMVDFDNIIYWKWIYCPWYFHIEYASWRKPKHTHTHIHTNIKWNGFWKTSRQQQSTELTIGDGDLKFRSIAKMVSHVGFGASQFSSDIYNVSAGLTMEIVEIYLMLLIWWVLCFASFSVLFCSSVFFPLLAQWIDIFFLLKCFPRDF